MESHRERRIREAKEKEERDYQDAKHKSVSDAFKRMRNEENFPAKQGKQDLKQFHNKHQSLKKRR